LGSPLTSPVAFTAGKNVKKAIIYFGGAKSILVQAQIGVAPKIETLGQ
jgi:hypothetical protein